MALAHCLVQILARKSQILTCMLQPGKIRGVLFVMQAFLPAGPAMGGGGGRSAAGWVQARSPLAASFLRPQGASLRKGCQGAEDRCCNTEILAGIATLPTWHLPRRPWPIHRAERLHLQFSNRTCNLQLTASNRSSVKKRSRVQRHNPHGFWCFDARYSFCPL